MGVGGGTVNKLKAISKEILLKQGQDPQTCIDESAKTGLTKGCRFLLHLVARTSSAHRKLPAGTSF